MKSRPQVLVAISKKGQVLNEGQGRVFDEDLVYESALRSLVKSGADFFISHPQISDFGLSNTNWTLLSKTLPTGCCLVRLNQLAVA